MIAAQAYAGAREECQAIKHSITPAIELDFQIAKPYILYDRSVKQIHAETNHDSYLSAKGMEALWSTREHTTLGYAQGGMASSFSYQFLAKAHDRYGINYCPFFKDLRISIIYRTLIRIPKELKGGGCIHDVVFNHEMRHHKANEESFQRYMDQLKNDLPEMIRYFERKPVSRGMVQKQFELMGAAIEDAVKLYIKDYAQREAMKINKEIDSPESYALDGANINACRENKFWRKTR
ncbi:MAG: hypothetical protein KTR28_04245 [Micavibrio sp.]|nr:hypothetical protein [Micavibrio sp.]